MTSPIDTAADDTRRREGQHYYWRMLLGTRATVIAVLPSNCGGSIKYYMDHVVWD